MRTEIRFEGDIATYTVGNDSIKIAFKKSNWYCVHLDFAECDKFINELRMINRTIKNSTIVIDKEDQDA